MIEGALRLPDGIHAVNVIAVQCLVEDDDRNVADTAQIDEVLDGEGIPSLDGMPDN